MADNGGPSGTSRSSGKKKSTISDGPNSQPEQPHSSASASASGANQSGYGTVSSSKSLNLSGTKAHPDRQRPPSSLHRHFSVDDTAEEVASSTVRIRRPRKPDGEDRPKNSIAPIAERSSGSSGDHDRDSANSSDSINHEDDDGDHSDTEFFTLKDRQNQINTFHPFGIRLWKPALYKKSRSVQQTAEGDIHSSPGGFVSNWLFLFNTLWIILFGWWLGLIAVVCAIVCYLVGSISEGQVYGRVFLGLASYFCSPFGKYVRLSLDEAYAEEDEGEGRSISEYEQWRSEGLEEGRLFFGPPTSSSRATGLIGRRRDSLDSANEAQSLLGRDGTELSRPKRRLFGRGKWNFGRVLFYCLFYTIFSPCLLLVSAICWLLVFTIPMGRVTYLLFTHLRKHPLALSFHSEPSEVRQPEGAPPSTILVCTYRSVGLKYWKYTVDGTNIILINLLALVIFAIVDHYVFAKALHLDIFVANPLVIFILSILSTIPLAYFIGQAVASISAQSSMGLGATINAFFSTVVEVFLYCVALKEGNARLVEGSIIGSIFAGILLLPGISMCFGALKRKTQRFNVKSASVTSTMLLFAVIGAFGPTLFYQMYGSHELTCHQCVSISDTDLVDRDCRRCYFSQVPQVNDQFYVTAVKPYVLFSAVMLFLSYIIGLLFTLRTHAALIWTIEHEDRKMHQPRGRIDGAAPLSMTSSQEHSHGGAGHVAGSAAPKSRVASHHLGPLLVSVEEEEAHQEGGHDAPNWGRVKSATILLSATLAYAVIAEILVDNVDAVLENVEIDEKFLGITLFALVPNATEFLNAISFAMNGNIALSMEIGSAYALQVCLLQIPALVFFSIYSNWSMDPVDVLNHSFTLIFPQWDMVTVILCVFLLSYMYGEGKSNYFKGSILVFSYFVVMVGFYLSGYSNNDVHGVDVRDTLAIDRRIQALGLMHKSEL